MKNITLHNYRCFESLTLDFCEGINLLIGDNSSGKTTLIHALSTVLNSFFSGFSDDNTRFIGLSKEDFRIINAETGIANEQPIKIIFNYKEVNASLELHSTKGRTLQRPLYPMISWSQSMYDFLFLDGKQSLALPLFANFSTADIHSVRKISPERFKIYEHKPSFGYYECLQGDGFLEYWTKRLLILQEGGKGELEVNGVKAAVLDVLGGNGCNLLKDMQIRHNQGKVYYILTDGREVDTDHLSDGLRRLINIVVDLGFRCSLLNKGVYGAEAYRNTSGTVLIDEIDLHLHPTLQSLVVNSIHKAFPGLQLIITSHAPMVMTGIPADAKNRIYKLGYTANEGYLAAEVNTYGLDASTIIESILGVTPRSVEVDEQLQHLFHSIDEERFDEAAQRLKAMREKFGDTLPDLMKADAMLDFLSNQDDKDQ